MNWPLFFDAVQFRSKPGEDIPWLYLGFYRDVIVYDHQKGFYWLVTNVRFAQASSQDKLRKQARPALERLKRCFEKSTISSNGGFSLKRFHPEISRHRFENMVRRAKDHIVAGDIYQANLSQRFLFDFEKNPLQLYDMLRNINPSPFSSFLRIRDLSIVSNSPERLIQKRGRWCQTKPIAGTRPRRTSHQSQQELERELISNEKERAEHLMLVDLERNDLGRVCEWNSVKVKQMMDIEKYSHVIHLVSTIEGKMRNDQDVFDLIRVMFPGGTITGCPKIRCMEIIDELEPVQRSLYTGSIGHIGFSGDLDLNIVIRTLILQKEKGFLQVGAGIVYDSDPAREYEETLHKGEALAEALVHSST